MIRLLVFLIIILFIVGIALAFVPFLVPQVAQALTPILCPDGGAVKTIESPSSRGGVSLSFQCVEGRNTSEANPIGYLLLFTAWCWLPLIPEILLVMALISRGRARAATQVPNVAEQVIKGSARGQPFNLTDKLQQLEDARSAGKITDDEYRRAKVALLRDL